MAEHERSEADEPKHERSEADEPKHERSEAGVGYTLERQSPDDWIMKIPGTARRALIVKRVYGVDRWNVYVSADGYRFDIEGFLSAQLAAIEMLTGCKNG